MTSYLLATIAASIVIFGGPATAHAERMPVPEEMFIACTMDAKLCPDGSYVSRGPPDCSFAPCPGEEDVEEEKTPEESESKPENKDEQEK